MNATTVINRDQIVTSLTTGGKASDPIRWYNQADQPAIAAIRSVNIGETDAADVDAVLAGLYPHVDPPITGDEVCLSAIPSAAFIVDVPAGTNPDLTVGVSGFVDEGIGLSDDNVRWVWSDGHIEYGAHGGLSWTPPVPGEYWVRCEVSAGGGHWSNTATFVTPDDHDPTPPTPEVPAAIQQVIIDDFSVSLSGVGEPSTHYRIYWGNGQNGDLNTDENGGGSASYIYPEAGQFTITIETESGTPSIFGEITVPGDFTYNKPGGDPDPEQAQEPEPEPEQAQEPELEPEPPASEPFDPTNCTVDDALDYAEQHPDEIEGIIEMEASGKNRVTLIDGLDAMLAEHRAEMDGE